MTFHHRHCFVAVEVTGDREDGVVRSVVRGKEVSNIVQTGRSQVVHRSDQGVMEGMLLRERERRQSLPPGPIRLVIHRPASFVLHDVALRVEFFLRHRGEQVSHAVRLKPQCQLELIGRNGFEIVRAIEPGGPVECSSRSLDHFEMLICRDVRRPLKEHVFEEMGEPGPADSLVGRANVIPDVHGDDGHRPVRRQAHEQPIRQAYGFYRNSHGSKLHDLR